MIRFVLRRKFRDAISGAEVDNQIFTVDAEVPDLEGELRRGGYGDGGYEIIELVGAEVLDQKCEHVANELDRIRKAVKQLASDHPDTPVSYPCNGKTYYQEIRDWANHALGGVVNE